MFVAHMISRNGQCLARNVMQGLMENDCEPMIVTSWVQNTPTKNRINRRNMVLNWKEAMRYPYGGFFILMQNNVILLPGCVHRAIHMLDRFDVVTFPVDCRSTTQHGLILIKEKVIEHFPLSYKDEKHCPLCQWAIDIKKGGVKIINMDYPVLKKADRLEIKRRAA